MTTLCLLEHSRVMLNWNLTAYALLNVPKLCTAPCDLFLGDQDVDER
jgi:hypothetical protein